MRLTRTRADVVTLVATWRELSALAAAARMALELMREDAGAPAEARALLARVLSDYDAARAPRPRGDGLAGVMTAGSSGFTR